MGTRRRAKKKEQSEYFFDYSLLFIVLFLLGFGLVMIYSASSYSAFEEYKDTAYYLKRQLIAVILGLALMIVVANIPYHFWERFATLGYLVAAALIRLKVPFLRKAFIPASLLATISTAEALAERAIMGMVMASARGSLRMARVASSPFITGI